MNVLVTGADGFVGSWVVPLFAAAGHRVFATVFSETDPATRAKVMKRLTDAAEIVDFDIRNSESVKRVATLPVDAVVHLAALSSGAEARKDPAGAWEINAAGTARLAEAVADAGPERLLLLVSTGEVYGRVEDGAKSDESVAARPISPYAASKLGAEIAVQEVGRRRGLRFIIARPFAHTGARQEEKFVVPAFAKRIIDGKTMNAVALPVGNLDNTRDFMHVSDVVEAYRLLLERGEPGETYNIASGEGTNLRDVFFMVADAAHSRVIPEVDAAFVRTSDIPYLVGDATKLRTQTGWKPTVSLKDAIEEVVNASSP